MQLPLIKPQPPVHTSPFPPSPSPPPQHKYKNRCRFSFSWTRILPGGFAGTVPNPLGIEHYNK